MVTVGQECSIDMMLAELALVVELTREEDGLNIRGVPYILFGRTLIDAVLLQAHNFVFTVHIAPSRLIGGIIVVDGGNIGGSVIYSQLSFEA